VFQKCPTSYDGLAAGFEGDSIWCPACKTHGQAKCVKPYLSDTGPDGRQQLLDGDLCMCRCPVPPRLVAKRNNHLFTFTPACIFRMEAESAEWLEYAGLTAQYQAARPAVDCGRLVKFADSETGQPMARRKFILNDGTRIYEGRTDGDGFAIIQAPLGQSLAIHLVFQTPCGEMLYEA